MANTKKHLYSKPFNHNQGESHDQARSVNRHQSLQSIPGADLRGCVNDVKNMQGVLTRYYGFKADEIAVLTDLAATKKAMQAAIVDLVNQGQAEDVLLLHYSGHGSNMPDDDGDEADNRDEILCPTGNFFRRWCEL